MKMKINPAKLVLAKLGKSTLLLWVGLRLAWSGCFLSFKVINLMGWVGTPLWDGTNDIYMKLGQMRNSYIGMGQGNANIWLAIRSHPAGESLLRPFGRNKFYCFPDTNITNDKGLCSRLHDPSSSPPHWVWCQFDPKNKVNFYLYSPWGSGGN